MGSTFPASTWLPVPASFTVASNGTYWPDSALGAPDSRVMVVGTWSGCGITFTVTAAALAETLELPGVYSAFDPLIPELGELVGRDAGLALAVHFDVAQRRCSGDPRPRS